MSPLHFFHFVREVGYFLESFTLGFGVFSPFLPLPLPPPTPHPPNTSPPLPLIFLYYLWVTFIFGFWRYTLSSSLFFLLTFDAFKFCFVFLLSLLFERLCLLSSFLDGFLLVWGFGRLFSKFGSDDTKFFGGFEAFLVTLEGLGNH